MDTTVTSRSQWSESGQRTARCTDAGGNRPLVSRMLDRQSRSSRNIEQLFAAMERLGADAEAKRA